MTTSKAAFASEVPWPTHANREEVPDTSMLPDTPSPARDADGPLGGRGEWAGPARRTVRARPLVAVVAALGLGVLIGRPMR